MSRLLVLVFLLLACACPSSDPPSDAPAPASPDAPSADAKATSATPAPATPVPATQTVETPSVLGASHILIQYQGSQRAKPTVTRTKEEALALAKDLLAKIHAGGNFEELAKANSDGPTGPRGGSLGGFKPGQMVPAFEAGLLTVDVGQLVPAPVETPFGFHVIRRDAPPPMYGAKHILVMHKESMRVPPTITRTKEEALTRAQEALAKAKGGADFTALAAEYSDGPTKSRGGDLGEFPPGAMVPEFEKGMLTVEPGNLVVDLVETPFGYHLIYRTK